MLRGLFEFFSFLVFHRCFFNSVKASETTSAIGKSYSNRNNRLMKYDDDDEDAEKRMKLLFTRNG